ncbi:SAM-dependent chlorinase/fluorinase [Nostoc flagelliforme FACHB-838]|uniref:SAM-dependent chlorinase/fluorinase n=1 Tax=Nostoc flagelliforme FACHB-838 TaxID=2692904 RepID=A0ABR8DMZ0_9NOSO|nr:SAM-dependent chlorinase/fluorinase [Nostoc flagelliforme]MBD2530826.1 SAM-dependent chlorinase/fluorinase [Nostoc flagelliforme FACHB-838]
MLHLERDAAYAAGMYMQYGVEQRSRGKRTYTKILLCTPAPLPSSSPSTPPLNEDGSNNRGGNAGYAFSFVRDLAVELRWTAVGASGSRFRSLDLFPEAAGAIALGQPDALGEEIAHSDIPDVPSNCITYIDGYGNLKTTIKHEESNDTPK